MNWDAIGAVAEILGTMAVLVTLAYLSIQVRQAGDSARTQSYHLAIEQLVNGALQPEFMSLLSKSDLEELTPEEELRLSVPLICFIYGHEILHYLWRKGQVDDELWENIFINNLGLLSMKETVRLLSLRPGPLSRDLEALIRKRQLIAS